jgi:hypothetical protein
MSEETLKLEQIAEDRQPVQLPDGDKPGETGRTVLMLDPRMLSFYDRANIAKAVQKTIDLNSRSIEKPTKKKARELEISQRELVALVLPDATEVEVNALQPLHLDQVNGAFLGRYGDMMTKIAEAVGMKTPMEMTTSGN